MQGIQHTRRGHHPYPWLSRYPRHMFHPLSYSHVDAGNAAKAILGATEVERDMSTAGQSTEGDPNPVGPSLPAQRGRVFDCHRPESKRGRAPSSAPDSFDEVRSALPHNTRPLTVLKL
jgi:hypothetical protein